MCDNPDGDPTEVYTKIFEFPVLYSGYETTCEAWIAVKKSTGQRVILMGSEGLEYEVDESELIIKIHEYDVAKCYTNRALQILKEGYK